MESFLEPVKSRKIQTEPLIEPLAIATTYEGLNLKNLKDVLDVLRNQPDIQSLQTAVKYLLQNQEADVKVPSPLVTPIIQTLVTDVVPNYWAQLLDDKTLEDFVNAVTDCLRSLPALGAIIARLKALINAADVDGGAGKRSFIESQITCLIQLLERICKGNSFVTNIWEHNQTSAASRLQKSLYWKELVSLLSRGKVISIVSEAETKLGRNGSHGHKTWLANGSEYSRWLARNVEFLSRQKSQKSLEDSVQLLGRSLSIGYTGVSHFRIITMI
jgi:telomere length regulation protein